ncbi:MAG: hypothetical protein ACO1RT_10110 [Planctomycetaceae bacterium]
MMIRELSWFAVVLAVVVSGCSSADSTNIMENADQAAIDAYDAQVAEDDKALGGYKEIE